MRAILVDDEINNMDAFEMEAEGIADLEIVGKFYNPEEALSYVRSRPVEMAMLDIEMPGIDGITLGHKLRECCPTIIIVYVTAYKQYAYEAFQVEASAYLLKPFNRADIERAMMQARKDAEYVKRSAGKGRIFIQTFGRFEVFVDGKPVEFTSRKAKELLALLVDRRGGIVTTEEMLAYLWEDKADSDSARSLCRKVVQRLHTNLEKYGISDIIARYSRGRSLETEKVTCDYYEYLEGNEEGRKAFRGEYMTNYSWAEETVGKILEESRSGNRA